MAVLIVNNKIFNYPDPGSQPGAGDSAIGYGEDATAWAKEVTAVLNSLIGRGDILTTTSTIGNGSVNQDVQFLVFSGSIVRAANVTYVIERKTDADSKIESGTLYLNYNQVTGVWSLAQAKQEDAEVSFSINSEGQVKYSSSTMTGDNHEGSITFQAKTLGQVQE